jgi:hypothetical protein
VSAEDTLVEVFDEKARRGAATAVYHVAIARIHS